MISENFFLKNLKHQMKRNVPLMLLLFLGFLLLIVVQGILNIERTKFFQSEFIYEVMGEALDSRSYEFYRTVGENYFLILFIGGAAVLLALVHFSYLHSGEKTDFYHSLPISREKLFLVRIVSGFLEILLPYAVSLLIFFGIGMGYGAVTEASVKAACLAGGGALLYFLVFYELTVLAILLTGNLFTAILGTTGLLVYVPLLYGVWSILNQMFFHTLYTEGEEVLAEFITPAITWTIFQESIGNVTPDSMVYLLYPVILVILLTAVCLVIYRIRPSESFHKAIAFKKLQPVIKVAVVVPVTLFFAAVFAKSMLDNRFLWFVLCLAVLLLVLSTAVEFLYTLDIRKSLKPKLSTGVAALLLLLLAAGYHVDLFGVDSYLPKKEKIETMSVYISSIENQYREGLSASMKDSVSILKEDRIENFEPIYSIAEMAVDFYKDKTEDDKNLVNYGGTFGGSITSTGVYTDTMVSVKVGFHMKSGKNVYRSYLLPETKELLSSVEKIYDNWEYRQQVLPTSYAELEKIEYFYTDDFFQSGRQVDAKGEKLEILYKTYKGELESMTFAQACEQRIIGYLEAQKKNTDEYGTFYYKFPIYEGFEKTRALLEQAGSLISDQIDSEEVKQIRIYGTLDADGRMGTYTTSDPEEIKMLLENISFSEGRYSINSRYQYNVSVEIDWEDPERELRSFMLKGNSSTDAVLQKLSIDNFD